VTERYRDGYAESGAIRIIDLRRYAVSRMMNE